MNRVSLTVQFDSEFLLFTTVSKETKCQRSLILAIIYLRLIYDKNLIIYWRFSLALFAKEFNRKKFILLPLWKIFSKGFIGIIKIVIN